jgi:hypothetical protein
MNTLLATVVDASGRVAGTGGRLAKRDVIAACLRAASDDEVEHRAAPRKEQRRSREAVQRRNGPRDSCDHCRQHRHDRWGVPGASLMRSIVPLVASAMLLVACAASPASSPDSYHRCDRNGDREQRVACEP